MDPRLKLPSSVPASPMQLYLEGLLAAAPEMRDPTDNNMKKAVGCQIGFIGSTVSGAVTHGPVAGTFQLLTAGQDARTKQQIMATRVFTAEHILFIDVAVEPSKVEVVPSLQ